MYINCHEPTSSFSGIKVMRLDADDFDEIERIGNAWDWRFLSRTQSRDVLTFRDGAGMSLQLSGKKTLHFKETLWCYTPFSYHWITYLWVRNISNTWLVVMWHSHKRHSAYSAFLQTVKDRSHFCHIKCIHCSRRWNGHPTELVLSSWMSAMLEDRCSVYCRR